jgi:hypothetical protein
MKNSRKHLYNSEQYQLKKKEPNCSLQFPLQQFFSPLSWRLFTAQHVSGVFPPITRSSMTAVAASGFTFVSWWQSCCVRGRACSLAIIRSINYGPKTNVLWSSLSLPSGPTGVCRCHHKDPADRDSARPQKLISDPSVTQLMVQEEPVMKSNTIISWYWGEIFLYSPKNYRFRWFKQKKAICKKQQ